MIEIEKTLVSFDIIDKRFACNPGLCKGICCVQGDSGAPLEDSEKYEIEQCLPEVTSILTAEARNRIQNSGVAVIDTEGDLVTNTLHGKGACVFAIRNSQGITICALELVWTQGKTQFRKPLSCHLYPVRITRYKYYDTVNYHTWDICKSAIETGENKGIPLYVFLKDAFIRKYGEEWYNQLVYAAENIKTAVSLKK